MKFVLSLQRWKQICKKVLTTYIKYDIIITEREVIGITDKQKEIFNLAVADLENGVNVEWAKFTIALILAVCEAAEEE